MKRLNNSLHAEGLGEIVVRIGSFGRIQLDQFEPIFNAPLLSCVKYLFKTLVQQENGLETFTFLPFTFEMRSGESSSKEH